MRKKVLGVFLAAILISLLVGCGNSNQEENTSYKEDVDPENIVETELGTLYITYKKEDLTIKEESGPVDFFIKGVQVADLDVADDQKGLFGKGNQVAIVTISVDSKNTSNEALLFYPNKSSLTTDAGDDVESDTFFSDVVGGPYDADIDAAGDVVFIIDSAARDVGQLNLTITGPTNGDDESIGEPIELTIDLD